MRAIMSSLIFITPSLKGIWLQKNPFFFSNTPWLCWEQNHAVSQRSGNENDCTIFSIIKKKRQ